METSRGTGEGKQGVRQGRQTRRETRGRGEKKDGGGVGWGWDGVGLASDCVHDSDAVVTPSLKDGPPAADPQDHAYKALIKVSRTALPTFVPGHYVEFGLFPTFPTFVC